MENKIKKKMAFIDNSNFLNWPMGGMLEYELSILGHLCEEYDVDLWGVSVDGISVETINVCGVEHKLNIYGNVQTKNKVIPNYWLGLSILTCKEFKIKKYDVIYAHTGSCFVGAVLGNKYERNTVKVYHQHGLSYKTNHSLMVGIQKPFYWLSQRMADIVFLVTDDKSAQNYSATMRKKSKATFVGIGSPIRIEKFNHENIVKRIEKRKEERIETFIYVGRLSQEKNVSQMIEAFRIFIDRYKSTANLCLIGDGPDRFNVEETINRLNLTGQVILEGTKPHAETFKLLENADAFLISSKGEGVSLAVLEAYASGLPVVCFSVPGLEAQIVDGVTGKVAEKLSPDSFADAMKFVEDNKTQLSFHCLETAKNYDTSIISQKIIDEIEKK